jgi:hypothetical protein
MAKSERIKGSRSPAPPKITIGDGSVRDLAYWLMGGNVSVKRGRKKVSSDSVREETKSIIPTLLKESRVREDKEQYGPAYNPLTDYSGKYSPKQVEERIQIASLNSNAEKQRRLNAASYEQAPLGEFYTGTGNPMVKEGLGRSTEKKPMYGRRRPENTQPMLGNPRNPVSPDRPRPLMNQYQNPKIQQEGEFGKNSDAYSGDPEFGYDYKIENDIMMTPPGAMAYGGMVTTPKKRKKKKMYGGKMKKYAKGGGIRKPKYS